MCTYVTVPKPRQLTATFTPKTAPNSNQMRHRSDLSTLLLTCWIACWRKSDAHSRQNEAWLEHFCMLRRLHPSCSFFSPFNATQFRICSACHSPKNDEKTWENFHWMYPTAKYVSKLSQRTYGVHCFLGFQFHWFSLLSFHFRFAFVSDSFHYAHMCPSGPKQVRVHGCFIFETATTNNNNNNNNNELALQFQSWCCERSNVIKICNI